MRKEDGYCKHLGRYVWLVPRRFQRVLIESYGALRQTLKNKGGSDVPGVAPRLEQGRKYSIKWLLTDG